MAELNVELRAKVGKLKSDLKKAEGQLKGFGNTAEATGKKTKVGLESANKSAGKALDSFSSLTIAGVGLSVIAVEIFRAFAQLGNQGTALSDTLKKLTGTYNLAAIAQRNLATASAKGISKAEGEIAILNSLLSIARDETESKINRQRALRKINKEYKDLLPNMDLENVNLAENKRLTDELTKSLIRKAKIQGAQSLIAKETEKILDLQNKELIDNANGWDVLGAALKSTGQTGLFGINLLAAGANRTGKEMSKAEIRIAAFTKTLNELLKADIIANGVFTKVVDKTKKKYLSLSKDAPKSDGLLNSIFGITPEATTNLEKKARLAAFKIGNALRPEEFVKPKEVESELTKYGVALSNFNTDLDNLITGGFSNTLSGIGQAIGSAMAEGGNVLSSVGKTLLGSFGAILSQLGSMMIEMGINMLLAKMALKSINPYLAIAGGVALVAIGSAFSSSVSSLGGSTGAVAGQGSSGSTSSGGSSSTFVGGSSGYGEVVFRIGGQELIGVLSRVSNKNQRFGLNG